MSLRSLLSPLFAAALLWTHGAEAQITLGVNDPAELALGAGGFDIVDGHHPAGLFRGEYRFGTEIFDIRPMLGVEATTKGAAYGYGGIGLDIAFGQRWVLTPNFAVGGFERGYHGTDLGSSVEFRSGAELDYRLPDQARLGLTFHHISNAGLTRRNPGEEEIAVVYALPLSLVLP